MEFYKIIYVKHAYGLRTEKINYSILLVYTDNYNQH